jgi:hypothetical protein
MNDPVDDPSPTSDLAEDLQRLQEELRSEDLSEEMGDTSFRVPVPSTPARFSPRAALLIDALMASHEPAPSDARTRLIGAVDGRMAERRTRLGFVQPLLKASRATAGRDPQDVANAIEIAPDELLALEDGSRLLAEGDEMLVARWINELETDDGTALEALRRSMRSALPQSGAAAYAGASEAPGRSADEFVARVAKLLGELRRRPRT